MLRVAALCNNASLSYGKDGTVRVLGDPTEGALLALSARCGADGDMGREDGKFLLEVPFDSSRKMMTVVYGWGGSAQALTKGAVEAVLARSTHCMKGGERVPLGEGERREILLANSEMAGKALRVIAFADAKVEGNPDPSRVEQGLTFLGMAGLMDAPRDEVPGAIALCRKAGIDVVMITGDNEETARAVASEIGLLREGDIVVNGRQLDAMDDAALASKVEHIRVYARVSPEHKLRIVEAWKSAGKVVAMTGDGVNDAPALKRSDIGIAMGVTGTDVTKEVSDVVLADDNFASIVAAVKEGRGIYENIRKCLAFLLSGNISEVLIVFIAIIAGYPLPLTAVQLLWINLVTDGLPALALAADPIQGDLMDRKPRRRGESIWKGMRPFLVDYPLILVCAGILLFLHFLGSGSAVELAKAQTITFTLIIIFEKFQAFSCRSLDRPLGRRALDNTWLVLATALTLALQVAIIYTPWLEEIFSVTPLSPAEWALLFGVGAVGYAYLELAKWLGSRSVRVNSDGNAA
jgi:Ca2+-transporting ATPase